jgi:8-oxo-dGTP diphosphatase
MSRREYPDSPKVGVGAVVIKEGLVLLIRRGIPPSQGLWAIPGGSLELGETLQQGAERELLEETGIVASAGEPIYVFDFFERDGDGRVRFHFVIVDMKAEYQSGEPKGADDALEARWLTPEDIHELPVSPNTLRLLREIRFL